MSVFRLRRSHPRMSTLGHKQTLEQASEMSALPHESGHAQRPEMSAKCQKQTLAIECTGRRSVLSHGRVQVATRARQSPPNYFRVVVWSGVSSITARKALIVLV